MCGDLYDAEIEKPSAQTTTVYSLLLLLLLLLLCRYAVLAQIER
jgi:hypothetical protein